VRDIINTTLVILPHNPIPRRTQKVVVVVAEILVLGIISVLIHELQLLLLLLLKIIVVRIIFFD